MSADLDSIYEEMRALASVRKRRIFAYLIDIALISILNLVGYGVISILGIFTLGLAWLAYGLIFPVVVFCYVAFTLGGAHQATPGMKFCNLVAMRLNGSDIDGLYAIIHLLLFYFLHIMLTPFILLVSLFSDQKRLLHDILLGIVIVRYDYDDEAV